MNEKGNKRFYKNRIFLIIMFIIGLLIASYPFISQQYYKFESNEEIREFQDYVSKMDEDDIKERFKLAQAYNKTLDPSRLSDPYTDLEKRGIQSYAKMLEVHEKIGFIEIPEINQNIPIYAGTSETVLDKGVGHLEGTSLPIGGTSAHSVLTAHRGLPNARLFTDLDKLKVGDKFYIHMLNQVLAYQVDQILVVEPTDFSPVLVVEGKDYSTLLTCTPYSINTHRLLVRGERITYTTPIKEAEIANAKVTKKYKYLLYFAVLILLMLLYILYKTVKTTRVVENTKNE